MRQVILRPSAETVENEQDFVYFAAIDLSLGESKRRYLGQGYKAVEHHFLTAHFVDDQPQLAATVSVRYPPDWSQKAEGNRLDVHLSTVDMLLVSSRMVEAILRFAYHLDEPSVQSSRLHSIAMNLGNAPTFSLEALGFTASVTDNQSFGDGEVSEVLVKVGKAEITVLVNHPAALPGRRLQEVSEAELLDFLGDLGGKFYGEGYRSRSLDHTDIFLNTAEKHLSGVLRICPAPEPSEHLVRRGIGASSGNTLQLLDLMLSGAQLAQILIYQSIGKGRDQTKNLWMRNFAVFCSEDLSGVGSAFPVVVELKKTREFTVQGKSLLLTDLTYRIPGVPDVGITGSFVLEL